MSDEPILSEHRTVLDFSDAQSDQHAVFEQKSDGLPGERDVFDQFWMPLEEWEAMGRPLQITVTIQPGDLLNG